jgi:peptidoglycan/xylan/chitin deacetylase (PgdA/CDA1 family)
VKVTLTFDNGPDPGGTTEHVLRVLRDANLRSSFFVTGQQLLQPGAMALAARARREGHWIGNHTFTHSTLFGDAVADPTLPDREIGETQRLLGELASPERWFRPYGAGGIGPHLFSQNAIDYLARGRYSVVLWNCTPRDWEGDESWVDRCVDDVQTREWSVVVLHDLPTGAMRFLESLLDQLRSIGTDFVQTFPGECVPMERGRMRSDLGPFTSVR